MQIQVSSHTPGDCLHSSVVRAGDNQTAAAIAHNVIRHLENIVGSATMAKAVASVANALKSKRAQRRQKRALQSVADVQVAARDKLERNREKREAKKRRLKPLPDEHSRELRKKKRERTSLAAELLG